MSVVLDVDPPYIVIKPGVREEDFYRLAGEDSDWELLDGRLVMTPASDRDEDLFSFLNALLRGCLDEHGGGVVRGSRYPMRLDERWSPEPDLLVVLDRNLDRLTPQRLEGAADLVIEIASEADPGFDLREKLPRYRQAGIPEMWFIDPFEECISTAVRTTSNYRQNEVRRGRHSSEVVPGFWIDVAWLWLEKLPSTVRCLREILGEGS